MDISVNNILTRAVVVVKWSACSPSTLMILVLIPLKLTVFSAKFVLEKNEIKQYESGVGPLKNILTVPHERL